MTIACHYAIVRFMPFVETGEFGNVGIALFAPGARFFGFQLVKQRIGRITNFFEQMDPAVFRASMRNTRDELQRIGDMLKGMGTDKRLKAFDREGALRLWQETLKPRESMVRFGDSRLVLTQDPQTKLKELFAFYVERNFVNREYQEQIMERSVRGWLRAADLQDVFHPARVGNDDYSAQFPFVELIGETPIKVIKPLRLDYGNPAMVIDHGGQWRVRLEALKKRGLLPPHILFAVNGVSEGDSPTERARRDVVESLLSLGVQVRPLADRQAVIDFAKSDSQPH